MNCEEHVISGKFHSFDPSFARLRLNWCFPPRLANRALTLHLVKLCVLAMACGIYKNATALLN